MPEIMKVCVHCVCRYSKERIKDEASAIIQKQAEGRQATLSPETSELLSRVTELQKKLDEGDEYGDELDDDYLFNP